MDSIEELPKERTLGRCSCCDNICWDNGAATTFYEWRTITYDGRQALILSVCNDCVSEADDQGITVEQLRERNNEHNVETEAY